MGSVASEGLALAEFQDGYRFHLFRLTQAVEKASPRVQQQAFAGEPAVLDPEEFAARMERGLQRLRAGRCTGATDTPSRRTSTSNECGDCWGADRFGHTMMLPEGYEPALATRWDQMMAAPPV